MSAASLELPAWLRRLADAASDLHPEDLSRLAPPQGVVARPSAVLIAFRDSPAGPAVLLIQRAAKLRRHPGQVAFPGGAVDPGDADYTAAALREAQEETELDPASVLPLAELPSLFISGSGFAVTPILAWWHTPHPLGAGDPAEVARVSVVPIRDLTEPANRFRVRHPAGGLGPGFAVDGLFVWGFTAMLLDRLLAFSGWERPWDHTRTRDLPPATAGGSDGRNRRADRERS